MSGNPAPLSQRAMEETYEKRFNCVVCLCARIEMVSGLCQHRICASCLYNEDNTLKCALRKCPICQKFDTFPVLRPDIPEDNRELMICLGVRTCPNKDKGCQVEMWEWEMEEHRRSCASQEHSPKQSIHLNKSRTSEKKKLSESHAHSHSQPRPATRSTKRLYNLRSQSDSK